MREVLLSAWVGGEMVPRLGGGGVGVTPPCHPGAGEEHGTQDVCGPTQS